MKDRIPVNPGRVLISPENGAPYYATMTRADNATQEGTPLNKNSLLRDATAALFGLGADAVPDNVLCVLSRFQSGLGNEYLWAKYSTEVIMVYDTAVVGGTQVNSSASDFYYAPSFHIDGGLFALDNPKKISWVYPSDLSDLTGKYCIAGGTTTSGNTMYLMDSGAYVYSTSIQVDSCTKYYNIREKESGDLVGYVNSPNSSAYPVDDGYIYTALGQLGNKVQIATGSYTGTGKYGESNPNSLTFDFQPKLIIIYGVYNQQSTTNSPMFLINGYIGTRQSVQTPGQWQPVTVTWGNKVSWSSIDANHQQNISGYTYAYIAIG